jgi:hypothetical protein
MKSLSALVLSLVIFASAFSQKVTTDMDKTVDFTKYKSYQFLGWQDNSDAIINDLDKERMRKSFKSEMDARQLEKKESGADMAISLYIVVSQETSMTAYTNYHGTTGYGYRRAGWGWGSGYATTTYSENDYLQGTLVMDVFDGESKELIWQGVATGTIQEKPEKREKSIPKTISKLMKKFPIQKVK